ncbi:MAG: hypothetical protein RL685_3303 [Pseudomonadota bacterium]|jgi:hypothetical protein
MGLLEWCSLLVAGGLLLLASRHSPVDRNLATWQDVARELGLRFQGGELERTIAGEIDGVSVHVAFRRQLAGTEPNEIGAEQVTFRGAENGDIPDSLVVRRDTATRMLGLRFGGRDVPIGDAPFDELAELSGLDARSCAALSHSARQQLLRFLQLGGEVQRGVLWFARDGSGSHERDSLLALLQFLSQLGKALAVTSDTLHQRLSDNALRDPSAGVRWRNLRFLAAPETQTPPALLASTARALLTDQDNAVRVLAGQHLGAEGFPVLRTELTDAGVHVEIRIAALRALAELRAPDLEPLLGTVLTESSPAELVCAALANVVEQRRSALIPAVARCSESDSESVRRAVAHALGKLAGGEPALLRLLEDTSPDVRQAAVEALAKVGSVQAVEPLLPLSQGLVPGPLRNAARAAITRIQARLGHVEAGRVSLADQQGLVGAVDLADVSVAVRVGELSLLDDVEDSDSSATELRATRARNGDLS